MPVDARSARPDARPIGVFDSGLGGLTVLRALIDLLPTSPTIYFGDTGRFPYGSKPADEVLKYSLEISDVLVDRGVKMLVIGCNSATSVALDALSTRYEIPVIGVVEPGVRAAAAVTETGRVGVIGTVGTIASGAYQRVARLEGVETRARPVRGSWSSSNLATSIPIRSTCLRNACSNRCGAPASTL